MTAVPALALGVACGDGNAGGGNGGGEPTASAVVEEVKTDFGVSDTEILLGQHVQASGEQGKAYAPMVAALKAYFGYVNQQGGVCDRTVRLLSEDDQGSDSAALQKAQKLAETDEVAAFVGNAGAQPNAGSAGYINEQEVPDLFLAKVEMTAEQEDLPWTVAFDPESRLDGETAALYMDEKLPDKPAGVLYASGDPWQSARDGFVGEIGAEVVVDEVLANGDGMSAQLEKMRNASPAAEIVYVSAPAAESAEVFGYLAANPEWKPWVVVNGANSPAALAELVGGEGGAKAGYKRMAGAITTRYLLDPVTDKKNPAFVEHVRYMKQFKGPAVSSQSLYGQALGEAAVQALDIACENGDLTREGIMEAARSIEEFHPSVLVEGVDITLGEDDRRSIETVQPAQMAADGALKVLAVEEASGE
jgi:ABC-type branched-subunit amino acid transport system substrate-binding protein